jgi:hypothetical protein
MTFDRFNELMLLHGRALPVLGLPLYLVFALVGKGASKIAVFLSLSAPGLLMLVYDMWGYLSTEGQVISISHMLIFL